MTDFPPVSSRFGEYSDGKRLSICKSHGICLRFELKAAQGVIFALSTKAKRDRIQRFGEWELELRNGASFVCARTEKRIRYAIKNVITEGHEATEQILDIVAVEERTALLCVEPHNNIAWRVGENGVRWNSHPQSRFRPGD